MVKRRTVCGLLGGTMLLVCMGTVFAAGETKTGQVNGMDCYGMLNVSATSVTATTKSVPANSSYIYAQAVAYMYPNGVEKVVSRNDVSYTGSMEVSAISPNTYGEIHHGRGYHTVDSWS